MANEPCDRGSNSVLSHVVAAAIADTTEAFTAAKVRSAVVSVPAASRAHVATSCWKNPTDPPARGRAGAVNCPGGSGDVRAHGAREGGAAAQPRGDGSDPRDGWREGALHEEIDRVARQP